MDTLKPQKPSQTSSPPSELHKISLKQYQNGEFPSSIMHGGIIRGEKDAGQQADEGNEASSSMPPFKRSRTNTPWTPAEEQRLKVMRDVGNSWEEIAKVGRSRPFQVSRRLTFPRPSLIDPKEASRCIGIRYETRE